MTTEKIIDSDKYIDFVKAVTSKPSLEYPALSGRLSELKLRVQM